MKRLLPVLFMLLLFTLPALAQDQYPRAEVSGGYSYLNNDFVSTTRDSSHGWIFSVTGNGTKHLGLEVEGSGHYGSVLGASYSNYLVMIGPRVAGRYEKVTPWGHTLFGVDHLRPGAGLTNENSFTWLIGGGVDYNVNKNWAVRALQMDYFLVNFDSSNPLIGNRNAHNFRLSFGVVYKWGGK